MKSKAYRIRQSTMPQTAPNIVRKITSAKDKNGHDTDFEKNTEDIIKDIVTENIMKLLDM